jgi:hypothetical protein
MDPVSRTKELIGRFGIMPGTGEFEFRNILLFLCMRGDKAPDLFVFNLDGLVKSQQPKNHAS